MRGGTLRGGTRREQPAAPAVNRGAGTLRGGSPRRGSLRGGILKRGYSKRDSLKEGTLSEGTLKRGTLKGGTLRGQPAAPAASISSQEPAAAISRPARPVVAKRIHLACLLLAAPASCVSWLLLAFTGCSWPLSWAVPREFGDYCFFSGAFPKEFRDLVLEQTFNYRSRLGNPPLYTCIPDSCYHLEHKGVGARATRNIIHTQRTDAEHYRPTIFKNP